MTLEPYWVSTFVAPARAGFQAFAAQFRQIVREAVAAQLDARNPACFSSGRTNSTIVAGMIGEVGGRPGATQSIRFEVQGRHEMCYPCIAAKRLMHVAREGGLPFLPARPRYSEHLRTLQRHRCRRSRTSLLVPQTALSFGAR